MAVPYSYSYSAASLNKLEKPLLLFSCLIITKEQCKYIRCMLAGSPNIKSSSSLHIEIRTALQKD